MQLRNLKKAVLKAAGIFFFSFLVIPFAAHAVPIGPDITAGGEIVYDTDASFEDETGNGLSGSFSAKEGGSDTTSTYSADIVTPGDDNPIVATFTETGDGFGLVGNSTAEFGNGEAWYLSGIDFTMELTNTTNQTQFIFLKIDLTHSVLAEGIGFASSQFTIEDESDEIFFSHLISDGDFGDEKNGNPLASSGDVLIDDSKTKFLRITLAGLATETITGAWTGEGGVFAEGDTSDIIFDTFVSIDRVQSIPEPATFFLMGCGLLGIARISRKASV